MDWTTGASISEEIKVTDDMVRTFAECTGDKNPIHLDEAYAKNTRFGQRIAHGMLTGSLISRVLAMRLGEEGIYLSQNLKFLKPVFIGDTVTVTVIVTNYRKERAIASLDTLVKNSKGELVVKGDAAIMMVSGMTPAKN